MEEKVLAINLEEPFKSLSDKLNIEFVNSVDNVTSLKDVGIIYIGMNSANSIEDSKETIIKIKRKCGYKNIPILVVGDETSMFMLNQAVSFGATSILTLPISQEKLIDNIERNSKPVGRRIRLDVSTINPFISGAKEVFEVMSGISVKRKSLFLKKDYKIFGEVSGIMGLTGDASGSVVISFSYDLAKKIISIVLDMEIDELETDDIKDGIGEILNMIAGQAKAKLAGTKYHFQLSIPTVVTGYGYEIYHPKNVPCIVVIFEALDNEFAIQISLAQTKK